MLSKELYGLAREQAMWLSPFLGAVEVRIEEEYCFFWHRLDLILKADLPAVIGRRGEGWLIMRSE